MDHRVGCRVAERCSSVVVFSFLLEAVTGLQGDVTARVTRFDTTLAIRIENSVDAQFSIVCQNRPKQSLENRIDATSHYIQIWRHFCGNNRFWIFLGSVSVIQIERRHLKNYNVHPHFLKQNQRHKYNDSLQKCYTLPNTFSAQIVAIRWPHLLMTQSKQNETRAIR